MVAGEMEASFVMFQEERFEVRQRVPLAEEPPYAVPAERAAGVELHGLHLGKFLYQGRVDREVLPAVLAGRLVPMLANTPSQELRHPEMRIAEQGGDTFARGQYLRIERPAAVAHQQMGPLLVYQAANEGEGLLRVCRQIGRDHLRTPSESISQGHGRHTLAAGKEAVEK